MTSYINNKSYQEVKLRASFYEKKNEAIRTAILNGALGARLQRIARYFVKRQEAFIAKRKQFRLNDSPTNSIQSNKKNTLSPLYEKFLDDYIFDRNLKTTYSTFKVVVHEDSYYMCPKCHRTEQYDTILLRFRFLTRNLRKEIHNDESKSSDLYYQLPRCCPICSTKNHSVRLIPEWEITPRGKNHWNSDFKFYCAKCDAPLRDPRLSYDGPAIWRFDNYNHMLEY